MTSTNWRIASFGSSLLELHPPLAGDGGHRFQSHLSTFFPLSASRRPRLVLLFLLGPLLRRMKNGPSFRSDREGDPHGDLLMRTTTDNGQAAEIDLPDSWPALLAAFHRSAVFGCPPSPLCLGRRNRNSILDGGRERKAQPVVIGVVTRVISIKIPPPYVAPASGT